MFKEFDLPKTLERLRPRRIRATEIFVGFLGEDIIAAFALSNHTLRFHTLPIYVGCQGEKGGARWYSLAKMCFSVMRGRGVVE